MKRGGISWKEPFLFFAECHCGNETPRFKGHKNQTLYHIVFVSGLLALPSDFFIMLREAWPYHQTSRRRNGANYFHRCHEFRDCCLCLGLPLVVVLLIWAQLCKADLAIIQLVPKIASIMHSPWDLDFMGVELANSLSRSWGIKFVDFPCPRLYLSTVWLLQLLTC